MIDTNQILQAGQAAQTAIDQAAGAAATIKTQMSPWMPALAVAAGWAGREINRAATAAKNGAEWAMSHGGFLKIAAKIFWN